MIPQSIARQAVAHMLDKRDLHIVKRIPMDLGMPFLQKLSAVALHSSHVQLLVYLWLG